MSPVALRCGCDVSGVKCPAAREHFPPRPFGPSTAGAVSSMIRASDSAQLPSRADRWQRHR